MAEGLERDRSNVGVMISSEVQRTLVKSPPELWAELSDPAALARHLGELGEIRIVRTEPEKTVEWTAENTTGTVSIQPSGWGTKVTLSVTRELAESTSEPESEPEPVAEAQAIEAPAPSLPEAVATAALSPTAAPDPADTPEPAAEAAPEPVATATPDPADTPELAVEPVSEPAPQATTEPEPRRGFFARLFGRRRHEQPLREVADTAEPDPTPEGPDAFTAAPNPTPGGPDAFAAVREALAQERFAAVHLFAAPPAVNPPAPQAPAAAETPEDSGTTQAADISAELMAAEEVAAEQVTAVLAAVLDRLGAAHHRPFSRA
jgi:hypothetical protein